MLRKNSTTGFCGWFCRDELKLSDLAPDGYIATARPSPVRDVLLIPLAHTTNKLAMDSNSFWAAAHRFFSAIRRCHSNPLQKIAFNFGRWETRQALDPAAIDCHAHAHFYLSRGCVDALIKQMPSNAARLRGRTGHPEDYLEEDARILEQNRLVGDEAIVTRQRFDHMDMRFDDLEALIRSLKQ